jgi:hypothetical protein
MAARLTGMLAPPLRYPNVPGPCFTATTGLLQACLGGSWLAAFSSQHPEYLALAFHMITATTLTGHLGMFAITLRDKKLIGQHAEMLLAGGSTLGGVLYVVFLFQQFPWLGETWPSSVLGM